MNSTVLAQLFAAPHTFHLGYDLFVTLMSMLVLGFLFYFTYNIYKLTYKKTVVLFGMAFFFYLLKYIATFGGRYLHYAQFYDTLQPHITPHVIDALQTILAIGYIGSSLLGTVLLASAIFKVMRLKIIVPTAFVLFSIIMLAQDVFATFIIVQLVILGLATAKVTYNSWTTKAAPTLLYTAGMGLLLISNLAYFTPWSFHFSFTSEIVLSGIAFGFIFLAMREK